MTKRLWETDEQFKGEKMTDHWLDDMLPGHNQHLEKPYERIYGPGDMPQEHPPIDNAVGHHHPYPGVIMSKATEAEILEDQFKHGGIQVAGGGAAWPLQMELTDIGLEDIAHSLAMKVRYTGHCTYQYSIAQHSCHVHDLVPPEDRREALLHDASEYVLPDVAAPVKHEPTFSAFFKPIEKRAEKIIAARFNLRFPFPPTVKYADNQMAWFEKERIMKPPKYPWMVWTIPVVAPAYLPDFTVWSWAKAKNEFLERAEALGLK